MIDVQVDTSRLIARLQNFTPKLVNRLSRGMNRITMDIQSSVKADKLSGDPLNRRSGKLSNSIHQNVVAYNTGVLGQIYSTKEAPYGRLHEYGGRVERMMTVAWGRRVKNPRRITANYPERSFMRSTLSEFHEQFRQMIIDSCVEA
jgi:phage gpG-like protein